MGERGLQVMVGARAVLSWQQLTQLLHTAAPQRSAAGCQQFKFHNLMSSGT